MDAGTPGDITFNQLGGFNTFNLAALPALFNSAVFAGSTGTTSSPFINGQSVGVWFSDADFNASMDLADFLAGTEFMIFIFDALIFPADDDIAFDRTLTAALNINVGTVTYGLPYATHQFTSLSFGGDAFSLKPAGPVVIPEPSTYLLMVIGGIIAIFGIRRRIN